MSSANSRISPPLLLSVLLVLLLCGPRMTWAQQLSPAAPPARIPLPIEPKTPEEEFEAALLLVELGRPEEALGYLSKFVNDQPSDELLLQLREEHGPATFLRLANIRELQPVSTRLLEMSNQAFSRFATDPDRIAGLIANLGGTPEEQAEAVEELRRAGVAVVPNLLRALNVSENTAQREGLLYTLVRIGEPAVPLLIAALESPNPDLRARVITALGFIGDPQAVPYLWYPAAADDQPAIVQAAARQAVLRLLRQPLGVTFDQATLGVVNRLMQQATEVSDPGYPWPTDAEGLVSVWRWDPEAGTVVSMRVSRAAAGSRAGMEFARQALALSPDNRRVHNQYLSLALAHEVYLANWGSPLPSGPGTAYDLALSAGPEMISEIVANAYREGRAAPLINGLRVLGQIGTRHQVRSPQLERSPVLAALDYPDRRVQFAAASTIMQIDPQTEFVGARRVVEIFARALTDLGEGARRALVIDPSLERSATISGFLADIGYSGVTAATGREGFRIAAERPDIDLILVHPNVIRWELSETLANLRADSRTAGLPIVIYGTPELRGRLRRPLEDYRLITYIIEPIDARDLETQLTPFLTGLRTPPLTPEQRKIQAEAAAYWLGHIASGQRTRIYNLQLAQPALIAALESPNLAPNALVALSAIPTRESQQAMATIVLDTLSELPLREEAAFQLSFHIQRHGLLLPTAQVGELHAAWRMSEDPRLATALGGVIGSLKPDSTLIGQRLREFAAPVAPAAPPAPPTPPSTPPTPAP